MTDQKREKEHGDRDAQVSSAVAHESLDSERPAILKPEPERTSLQRVLVTRFPARRRNGSVKSAHHPIAKSALRVKPEAPKPAIALAGSISGRIVVVSAEQVQREREAACPGVGRPGCRALASPADEHLWLCSGTRPLLLRSSDLLLKRQRMPYVAGARPPARVR